MRTKIKIAIKYGSDFQKEVMSGLMLNTLLSIQAMFESKHKGNKMEIDIVDDLSPNQSN